MAEADLDAIMRQTSREQAKRMTHAMKKRRDQIVARAAKAKDKESRDQLRLIAKRTMEFGTAAIRRLQNSAEIAADAYARAMRNAAEEAAAMKAAKPAKKDGVKAGGKRGRKDT